MRLEPHLEFIEFVAKVQEASPEYCREVKRGRQALVEETESNEARTLPIFVPSFSVAEQDAYGYQMYIKCGVMTEAEICHHTGKTPAALGMKAWDIQWTGPGAKVALFLVSLKDLPPDLVQTIKRVKIFHQVQATRDKLQLTPATMLSKSQHHSVFQHVTNNVRAGRPPMSGELFSLPQLIDLAARINTELEHMSGGTAVVGEGPDADDFQKNKVLDGLQPEAGFHPLKKKRRTQQPPPAQGLPALTGPEAFEEGDQTSNAASRISGSKKGKMNQEDLDNLDPLMKRVALVHLNQGNRNAKANCLAFLTHDIFANMVTDMQKGQSIRSVLWHVY